MTPEKLAEQYLLGEGGWRWNPNNPSPYDGMVDNNDVEAFNREQAAFLAGMEADGDFRTLYLELRVAAEALVELKNWKDKHGKDEHYLNGKALAWYEAKKFLNELNK